MNSPSLPAARGPALRSLAALPDAAWHAFLAWTAIGAVVMPLGLGQDAVRRWLPVGGAQHAARAFLHNADAVWILLAAATVYLHAAAAEGLAVARRWALIILASSAAVEWIGTRTGYPFGPYRYAENFGWRLGGVLPVAIPFAWVVIVLAGRYAVLWVFPAVTRRGLALGVGLVAVATDLNLEFIAWKVRGYWMWYPDQPGPLPGWPPVQNYLSWFGLSLLLTYLLPPNYALRPRRPSPARPLLVLGLMNALFLLVHLTRFLGFTAG